MLMWLVFSLSGDSHLDKDTCVLFGLLATQQASRKEPRHVLQCRTVATAGEAIRRPEAVAH